MSVTKQLIRLMLRFPPLVLALAFAVPAAHAQPVFRSVMPDGKIIYGDKPAPGAKEAKQVNLPKPNISTPSPSGTGAPAAADPNAPPGGNAVNVEIARQNLDAAKKALEAGREPQPGERTGTASGMSRLNESYNQRIKVLEDAVTDAQNAFDNAQRSR